MSCQTAQQQKLQLNNVRPLPEPAATIWRIIRKECRGRENAIRMPALAARVGVSTRTVQSEIEYLINEHGKRIGSSCGKKPGYYIITDREDLEITFQNRVRRGIANFRSAYALKKSDKVKEALGQVSTLAKD